MSSVGVMLYAPLPRPNGNLFHHLHGLNMIASWVKRFIYTKKGYLSLVYIVKKEMILPYIADTWYIFLMCFFLYTAHKKREMMCVGGMAVWASVSVSTSKIMIFVIFKYIIFKWHEIIEIIFFLR